MHRLPELISDGLIGRADLVASTSSTSVKRWLRTGAVVQVQPGVLALPGRAAEWVVRARAATRWSGGPLSHISALVASGLVAADDGPIHVTVSSARCPRGGSGVLVHRSDRRLVTVRHGQLHAVEPERGLVDAWAWAHTPRRNPRAATQRPVLRRAVIEAVRTRAVRVPAVRRAAMQLGAHPGRPALLGLLELIAGGCESELEIWGVQHVLPGPPVLPRWVQQHPVRFTDGRVVRLDAAYVAAKVAVELDGAAFHGSRDQRERDLRRDTALATVGWLVLRFSYHRLMADPEGCRREIVAAVLARLAH